MQVKQMELKYKKQRVKEINEFKNKKTLEQT